MLQKKNAYAVAVVGATGTVGRETVAILEERDFPVTELVLLASERSAGERIEYKGKNLTVKRLADGSFQGVDIAFFTSGSEQNLTFAQIAAASGTLVIDTSGAFRTDPKVPLVIPEVNAAALGKHDGVIANPDCSSIGLLMILKPLHDAATVKRVVVTTFQSVSASGKAAMDELAGQTVALLNFKDTERKAYPHQIAFNCLPHVGSFLKDGYTKEERDIVAQTRKILNDGSIRLTMTSVRVPLFRGLAESVNVETEKKLSANEARAFLAGMPGVVVYDDPSRNIYPLPLEAVGKDEVFVGRVREDDTVPNGLSLWIATDNLRKGAALNAVQIAECLIK